MKNRTVCQPYFIHKATKFLCNLSKSDTKLWHLSSLIVFVFLWIFRKQPKEHTQADWLKLVFLYRRLVFSEHSLFSLTSLSCFYLTIRLWARDFYLAIVNKGAACTQESGPNNLLVLSINLLVVQNFIEILFTDTSAVILLTSAHFFATRYLQQNRQ